MSDAANNQRTQERPAESRNRTREGERPATRQRADPKLVPLTDTPVSARKQPGLTMEEAIVTPGRTGECHIVIEKFWVEVEGNLPAGFIVTTEPGHGLEVTLEQRSYRKAYEGTGSLKTGLTPIAPVGTKGRLIAVDTMTGARVEQPWTWKPLGSFSGLWERIKRLFWKG